MLYDYTEKCIHSSKRVLQLLVEHGEQHSWAQVNITLFWKEKHLVMVS